MDYLGKDMRKIRKDDKEEEKEEKEIKGKILDCFMEIKIALNLPCLLKFWMKATLLF